ncbi:GerAB/ArcD/ProY family transporter [Alicyclobacillus dauci]|uniref:Endospore germination permease n=1 Tax=Alicyclobacillus dauci TaxID=1475485 RepID=A0ABY6Z520_9BACL|nr:endospore germination permease [Alicyclobacillus dauci]WAH37907.1 endospore germination permease [Alicyclobacillus dauci]
MNSIQRISPWQLMMLLLPIVVATEILPVTDLTAKFAHERAWMSMMPATVTGFWCVLVLTELARRHPGRSIVQYSMDILGKWPGRFIGVVLLCQTLIYTSKVGSETMTFVSMFALPRTPRSVILLLFLTACGIATWAGIEIIARCAETFIPILIGFFVFVFVLLLPNMHPSFIRPVVGPYWVQTVFQAAIVPSAWYGEFVVLGFLLPLVKDTKNIRKSLLWLLLGIACFVALIALQSTMVAGPPTEKLTYSYYITARYISLGDFFERIDPLIVSIWMYGMIIKEALCLFVTAICLVHLTGLSDHRLVTIPVTLLSLLCALWFFPNIAELRSFLTYTFPFEGFIVQNLIPTFILGVDSLRRAIGRPAHA